MKAWKQGELLSESDGRRTGLAERSGYIDGEGKNNPVTKTPSLSCLVYSFMQGPVYTCKSSLANFDFVLLIHNL